MPDHDEEDMNEFRRQAVNEIPRIAALESKPTQPREQSETPEGEWIDVIRRAVDATDGRWSTHVNRLSVSWAVWLEMDAKARDLARRLSRSAGEGMPELELIGRYNVITVRGQDIGHQTPHGAMEHSPTGRFVFYNEHKAHIDALRTFAEQMRRERDEAREERLRAPLCGDHAATWFCERNTLPEGCWLCNAEQRALTAEQSLARLSAEVADVKAQKAAILGSPVPEDGTQQADALRAITPFLDAHDRHGFAMTCQQAALHLERLSAEVEELRDALEELVRLKDIKERMEAGRQEGDEADDYNGNKDAAWAAARAAIDSALPAGDEGGGR